jgi:putative addiction module killer protein
MAITFDRLYPVVYTYRVIEVRRTGEFDKWLKKLHDAQARVRILTRVKRLSFGNPGDVKPVGNGVSEMRIPYGPGYRVYYTQQGDQIVVLLVGGDKSSQERDIAKAKELAAGL